MKFATAACALLLGAAQADFQNNAKGTQVDFSTYDHYTLYWSVNWEKCQSRKFSTEAEAMKVYNTHPGWEVLFDGDEIMHVYQPYVKSNGISYGSQ